MRIGEIFQEKDFGLSIEIFPPKTSKGDSALIETLERLSVYRPDFVSCTYGAGGSTRERTLEWCVEIQKRFQLTATSHLTCVGSTRDELCEWLSKAQQAGERDSCNAEPCSPAAARTILQCVVTNRALRSGESREPDMTAF